MDVFEWWDTAAAGVDRLVQLLPSDQFLGNRWIELGVITGLIGAWFVTFMRFAGFPSQLRHVRRQLMGTAYQILLYRRHPLVIWRAEARLGWLNASYLFLLIPTIGFGTALASLLYEPLANRYAFSAARVGEPIVVQIEYGSTGVELYSLVHIEAAQLKSTATVRVPATRTVWLRVEALTKGLVPLQLGATNLSGRPQAWLNAEQFDQPAMRMQHAGNVARIHIAYPPRAWWGLTHGWVIYGLASAVLAALPVSRTVRLQL